MSESTDPIHESAPHQGAPNRLRVLQVIVLALISSLTAFSVLAAILGPQVRTPTANSSAARTSSEHLLMMALGAIGLLGLLLLTFLIRPAITRKARWAWQTRPSDEVGATSVWSMYMVRTIVTAAFIEGIGLFGGIIHMLTGALPPIAAPVIAIVLLICIIPTRGRLQEFVKVVSSEV